MTGKSPEVSGAVSALVVVVVFPLLMALAGGNLRSPAVEPQPEAISSEPVVAAPSDAETPSAPPRPAPGLSHAAGQIGEPFVERFDGPALDEQRWFISDGWTNGDWMENDWRRSQVSLTSEGLRLTLGPGSQDSDKPFASGEIRTHREFRHGYFEVSMRVPRDAGLVVGMFTYSGGKGRVKPNEIDIEIIGRATNRAELTIHAGGRATSKIVELPFDAADGFHTFGFEWLPTAVRWYADGVLIHKEAGPRAAKLTRPQQVILSLWASRQLHEWVGELDPSRAPWTLDINCAAYSPAYAGAPLCS